MANDLKGDASVPPDLATIQNDLTALKGDLAALISHLRIGARDGIGDAAGQIGAEASRIGAILSAQGQRSVKAVGHRFNEQPVVFLLAAFVVGVLGGRVLSR